MSNFKFGDRLTPIAFVHEGEDYSGELKSGSVYTVISTNRNGILRFKEVSGNYPQSIFSHSTTVLGFYDRVEVLEEHLLLFRKLKPDEWRKIPHIPENAPFGSSKGSFHLDVMSVLGYELVYDEARWSYSYPKECDDKVNAILIDFSKAFEACLNAGTFSKGVYIKKAKESDWVFVDSIAS